MDQHLPFVRTTAKQRYSKRLRVYQEQTVPILSHYAEQGNLLEVDGEQQWENIVEEIVRAIQSRHYIAIGGRKTPTGRNVI